MKDFLVAAAAVALVALMYVATRWDKKLESGLPPRSIHASQAQALDAARAHAAAHGGMIRPVLGTGSMAPYIPAAAPGLDPRATVVAYVITAPGAAFADVRVGALVVYVPEWSPSALVMHQAAQHDGAGWIMSGLANRSYENTTRVTAANFVGLATHVFTWDAIARPR